MLVSQAFRFELDPNEATREALAKHVGAARFVYNWGLARCLQALEEGRQIPSAFALINEWNRWKREHAHWWVDVSTQVPNGALRNLELAFRNWRQGRARKPRFKRKKTLDDNSAYFTGSIRVFPRHVQLPRLGKIRTKERTDKLLTLLSDRKARIVSATVSRDADRWYVSLTCEVERPDPELRDGEPVGVDLGLSSFVVLSDGTRVDAPKPLAKAMRILRRRSQQLSRKQKGSKNYEKAVLKLSRSHRRVRNIRFDFLHKLTTWLARTKPVIVVEDLNVRGLMRGWLSRSVLDAGWGTFRQMLEYKTKWYGSQLVVAPRGFPSTRRCSCCGTTGPRLSLSTRVFRCASCGHEQDRDLNAALNLQKYGLATVNSPTESSSGSDACGDPSGGGTATMSRSTSHGSMKQEAATRAERRRAALSPRNGGLRAKKPKNCAPFITFEGIDGAGKTTLAKWLTERLKGVGIPCIFTCEPQYDASAGVTHGIVSVSTFDPSAELYWFLCDRYTHVSGVIRPALIDGTWVICDRYTDSTLVYQGYGGGIELNWIRALNRFVTRGLEPDITVLIDLPVDIALERANWDDQSPMRDVSFYQHVRFGYLEEAKRDPDRFVILDGTQPLSALQEQLLGEIEKYIKSLQALDICPHDVV